MRLLSRVILLSVLLLFFPNHTFGHELSDTECIEGSQFIENTAHARNNGIKKDEFLARFDADVYAISAFPPEYRWFVQDHEDEVFLRSVVVDVFDDPRDPNTHALVFLGQCRKR